MTDSRYMLNRMKREMVKGKARKRPSVPITLNSDEKIRLTVMALLIGLVVGGTVWIAAHMLCTNIVATADKELFIAMIATISALLAALFAYHFFKKYHLKSKSLQQKILATEEDAEDVREALKAAGLACIAALLQEQVAQKKHPRGMTANELEQYELLLQQEDRLELELQKAFAPFVNDLHIRLVAIEPNLIRELQLNADPVLACAALQKNATVQKYVETQFQPAVKEYVEHHPNQEETSNERSPLAIGAETLLTTATGILVATLAAAALAAGGITALATTLVSSMVGVDLIVGATLIGFIVGAVMANLEHKEIVAETQLANLDLKSLKVQALVKEITDEIKAIMKRASHSHKVQPVLKHHDDKASQLGKKLKPEDIVTLDEKPRSFTPRR